MRKKTYTIEALILAVRNAVSMAGVLRALSLAPAGGNYAGVSSLAAYCRAQKIPANTARHRLVAQMAERQTQST